MGPNKWCLSGDLLQESSDVQWVKRKTDSEVTLLRFLGGQDQQNLGVQTLTAAVKVWQHGRSAVVNAAAETISSEGLAMLSDACPFRSSISPC